MELRVTDHPAEYGLIILPDNHTLTQSARVSNRWRTATRERGRRRKPTYSSCLEYNTNFGTLIIKGFGFNTLVTMLMQIPYSTITTLSNLLWVYLNSSSMNIARIWAAMDGDESSRGKTNW